MTQSQSHPAPRVSWWRALTRWVSGVAHGPRAEFGLFAIAVAEASICPMPVEVALGPMAAAHPEKWVRFGAVTAIGSLLGGALGYAIGYFAAETIGAWMFHAFGMTERFQAFRETSQDMMPWVIMAEGLTPISYKWVAIASGILHVPLYVLTACSLVTRPLRFFTVAYLFKRFGPGVGAAIERRLGVATLIAAGVIVALATAIFLLR